MQLRQLTQDSMVTIFVQYEEEYCTDSFLDTVLGYRFSFNGESHSFNKSMNWTKNPSDDIEWHILLHKFYYAPGLARRYLESNNRAYLDCLQHLMDSWISQTPDNFIATDVTARRIQNWIYALYLLGQSNAKAFSFEFYEKLYASLSNQVETVIVHLAPSRNHRTMELYAIFLASLLLKQDPKAAKWQCFAVEEMINNIYTDLQEDGVHCEQSTDYHHIVLRSFLLFYRLALVNNVRLPADIKPPLCMALDFAMHVHRPDGHIPALSDSDSRSYLELLVWGAEIFQRLDYAYVASAGALGEAPRQQHAIFPTSGYAVLRSRWDDKHNYQDSRYLVFDSGPVGAGNHGHMDALSIEVAAYGRPLIVDPGRYTYLESDSKQFDWRAAFRSTTAHNTISVDNMDQGIYRRKRPISKKKIIAPLPKAQLLAHQLNADMAYLYGKVESPNYQVTHHRRIWFARESYWVILDSLLPFDEVAHSYRLRYQLGAHADDKPILTETNRAVEAQCPGLIILVAGSSRIHGTIESGWVSTSYGSKSAAPRLQFILRGYFEHFLTILYPMKNENAEVVLNFRENETEYDFNIIGEGMQDRWHWDKTNETLTANTDNKKLKWDLALEDPHA